MAILAVISDDTDSSQSATTSAFKHYQGSVI